MKGKAKLSASEWVCKRHGFVMVPEGATKKDKPKCKWCGTPLARDTWTLSPGR